MAKNAAKIAMMMPRPQDMEAPQKKTGLHISKRSLCNAIVWSGSHFAVIEKR
jgi:hypothetical protein